MINLYQEIIGFDGVNFHDHLERIGVFHIFEPILTSKLFEDNLDQIKVCKYIAYTHSIESTKIHVGGDRRKQLAVVFKDLMLKDDFYTPVILLEDFSVIEAVKGWMKKQDDKQLEYLLTLQDAYIQQQSAAVSMLPKSSGGVDYDQKMRCVEHMTSLKKMIKDAESELMQNDPKLREAYEEVKGAIKKHNTLGPEKYSW